MHSFAECIIIVNIKIEFSIRYSYINEIGVYCYLYMAGFSRGICFHI